MSSDEDERQSTIRGYAPGSSDPSTRSNTSLNTNHRIRRLREKLTQAKDYKKLHDLCFEYDDVINSVNSNVLNSWHNIEGYKFVKSKGSIIVRKNETKYNTNKQLRDDIEKLKTNIDIMQKYIEAIVKCLHLNNLDIALNSTTSTEDADQD